LVINILKTQTKVYATELLLVHKNYRDFLLCNGQKKM